MRICILTFLLVRLSFQLVSQEIQPKDGSILTQTSVLLEVPEVIGATQYNFQIHSTRGTQTSHEPNQALIVDNLNFGESYTWEVQAFGHEGKILKTFNNSFEIATSALVDTTQFRFRINREKDASNPEGVMFLDYSRVAISADGKPVWFMPENEKLDNKRLRDFKLTNRGTLTYLDITQCEEMNLQGNSIWVTPSDGSFSGDSLDYYHHEFTRLSNGNYMVLGKSFVESDIVINEKKIETIPLSIIIEYNPAGEVVWTWSSNDYIHPEDIIKVGQKVALGNTFGHMNSFYFDEPTGVIYAGFRDLNCILAIDKVSGNLIRSYGDKISSDTTKQAIGFFSKQHAPIKISDNRLLLFNNNDRNQPSSVQIISEVTESNPTSTIEWEFVCDFDTLMPASAGRMGNAIPLESETLLVNMGQVARIFAVTPDKRVLWQCFPEQWNASTQTWAPKPNYRVFRTSSLLPFYFTMQIQRQESEFAIRIDNEGSENDTYEVIVYKNKRTKEKAEASFVQVDAKSAAVIDLKLLYPKKLPKTIIVQVVSKGNPDHVSIQSYQLKSKN